MIKQDIDYKIVRMKRKSLALHILKDGTVEVRAPHRMPEKTLTDFVEQKQEWIKKAKERQASAILLPTYMPKEIEEMRNITLK